MSASATVRVEKATSDLLIGPDWTMNMDICDSINTDHWQAKDVVKAVKKRLQHKNPTVQFLALTLLETMIKNCGDFVHFQVVERDILQEMVKIVRKKTDMQVRNKILVLLDSWQEAFGGPGGKFPQYYWAYIDLKKSGVEFPQRSADSALIFSPPVTHPTATANHPQIGYGMPSNSSMRLDEAMASEMANLSLSDLDRFRSVMDLLGDMLKAVNPNDREAIKDEVITDLVGQCRANQKRLLQMVNSTGDEELLGQGLALNDALQGLLSKHDAIAAGSPLPAEASETIASPGTPPAPTLALAPAPAPAPARAPAPEPAPAANGLGDEEEEEDDDFAQLARRNSKYKPAVQSTSGETSEQVVSPTGTSTSEASSAVGSNALALPDPPAPVRTATKEQDMIDLLSITLSSNPSPPRTPITPPTASVQSGSPATASPNGQAYPYNPQPYPVNQGYIPYNNYVAPWAQPQLRPPQLQPQPQPQVLQHPSNYPPPPWEATTSANPNPFTPSTYQYPASTANTATSYMPVQSSRPRPQYTSYGSPVQNKTTSETQLNANARQTGAAASPKPYILQNRLFEDLVDLKNAGGSPKMSSPSHGMPSSPGQGMISGRK